MTTHERGPTETSGSAPSPIVDAELDRIAAIAASVSGADAGVVALESAAGYILPGAFGLAEPLASQREVTVEAALTDSVVRSAAPRIVRDALADEELARQGWAEFWSFRSYVGVPVRDVHGHVVGALGIMSRDPHDFDDVTVARLTDLAEVCSARVVAREILERLSSAERSASTADRVNRVLLTFSEALGGTSTSTDVARTVSELARAQLDVSHSAVVLDVDGRFDALEGSNLPTDHPMEYAELQPGADHPGPHAVADGQPRLYVSRGELLADYPHLAGRMSDQVDGEVYLPFQVERGDDEPLAGWLWLGWADEHVTTTQTRRMKQAVTTYVARALERAELLAARAAVAYTLQAALLTQLPQVPGLELAARYLPASRGEQVGGDWYDAIHVHGATTLIIGDVVGHNIAAAAQMGNLRSMLRGFVADAPEPPSRLLARLDDANLRLSTRTMATAVVAQVAPSFFDGGPATVVWSSAGHLPPAPPAAVRGQAAGGPRAHAHPGGHDRAVHRRPRRAARAVHVALPRPARGDPGGPGAGAAVRPRRRDGRADGRRERARRRRGPRRTPDLRPPPVAGLRRSRPVRPCPSGARAAGACCGGRLAA